MLAIFKQTSGRGVPLIQALGDRTMATFSERKGLKPVRELIQINSMDEALRTSLWNALDVGLWSIKDFCYKQYGEANIFPFSKLLWFDYLKRAIDSRPDRIDRILEEIREYFFKCEWFEVYDFLEFVLQHTERTSPQLPRLINNILERELSGFRYVGGHFTDITNEQELAMLNDALADGRFGGVTAHLQRGFELHADRQNPDYRNSIKESISAVESMAKILAEDPKATLGDALKSIERRGKLHTALKEGFMKLYGYTSDEGGIRHAMLDEPNLTAADARYFLLSCTSFVNYLKAQVA